MTAIELSSRQKFQFQQKWCRKRKYEYKTLTYDVLREQVFKNLKHDVLQHSISKLHEETRQNSPKPIHSHRKLGVSSPSQMHSSQNLDDFRFRRTSPCVYSLWALSSPCAESGPKGHPQIQEMPLDPTSPTCKPPVPNKHWGWDRTEIPYSLCN